MAVAASSQHGKKGSIKDETWAAEAEAEAEGEG